LRIIWRRKYEENYVSMRRREVQDGGNWELRDNGEQGGTLIRRCPVTRKTKDGVTF
jgi:hypothetical protein